MAAPATRSRQQPAGQPGSSPAPLPPAPRPAPPHGRAHGGGGLAHGGRAVVAGLLPRLRWQPGPQHGPAHRQGPASWPRPVGGQCCGQAVPGPQPSGPRPVGCGLSTVPARGCRSRTPVRLPTGGQPRPRPPGPEARQPGPGPAATRTQATGVPARCLACQDHRPEACAWRGLRHRPAAGGQARQHACPQAGPASWPGLCGRQC